MEPNHRLTVRSGPHSMDAYVELDGKPLLCSALTLEMAAGELNTVTFVLDAVAVEIEDLPAEVETVER